MKRWFHGRFFRWGWIFRFSTLCVPNPSSLLLSFYFAEVADHNVEISEFFCHLDFTWNQFWRIYIETLELPFIPSFGFCFQCKKSWKIEIQNLLKMCNFADFESLDVQTLISRKILCDRIISVISTLCWWCCLSKPILCSKSVMIEILELIPYKKSQKCIS